MGLTIETKCWSGDWRWVLNAHRFEVLRDRCEGVDAVWTVWINNGPGVMQMTTAADRLFQLGLIDTWGVVSDFARITLDQLNISIASFSGGYYYSIAELVGICQCSTKFLLHFSGDSMPLCSEAESRWLTTLIKGLDDHPSWSVANLTWDNKFDEARRDSSVIQEPWAIGYGFSDQMYLLRAAEFKLPIYDEVNVAGSRYPSYGGNLFEKRVDAYMRNHGRQRATLLTGAYRHKNYPKSKWQSLFWKKNWP